MMNTTKALDLALKALEILKRSFFKGASTAQHALPLTELQKDAANLLFALHDAWPYVHQHCMIKSKKKFIQSLIVKHGEFADLQPPAAQPAPVQEPVAFVHNETGLLRQANRAKGGDFEPSHWTALYTTPPAAQAAPVKVWEAEGYDALMKEMQVVKARNIRQHAEIERLSALVRAQQITIDKLEASFVQQETEDLYELAVKADNGGQP